MPFNAIKLFFPILIVLALGSFAFSQAPSAPVPEMPGGGASCEGEFLNPMSDICWECLAPLTIGDVEVFKSKKYDYDNPSSPICFCEIPGIAIGYWEPRRLMDVTKKPWCFPNLGGEKLDPGIGFETGSSTDRKSGNYVDSWHVHYYIYPILSILELITDAICSERPAFDIGYVTELDPLWNSDVLSMIIHPEAIVFANPIAAAACTQDCIESAAGRTNEDLFWCMGCNNTVYPMNGNTHGEAVLARGALAAAQKMNAKLHRQLIQFTSAGSENLCAKTPEPLMDKRQYRYQMTQPKAITDGNFTCPNYGFPTSPYDVNVTTPVKGEDFGFLLWAKRNCCAL